MTSSVVGILTGRLYYHKVIDVQNPRRGITELRYIDPRKIRKVIEMENKKDKQFVDPKTMESTLRLSLLNITFTIQRSARTERLLVSRLLLMPLPSPIWSEGYEQECDYVTFAQGNQGTQSTQND